MHSKERDRIAYDTERVYGEMFVTKPNIHPAPFYQLRLRDLTVFDEEHDKIGLLMGVGQHVRKVRSAGNGLLGEKVDAVTKQVPAPAQFLRLGRIGLDGKNAPEAVHIKIDGVPLQGCFYLVPLFTVGAFPDAAESIVDEDSAALVRISEAVLSVCGVRHFDKSFGDLVKIDRLQYVIDCTVTQCIPDVLEVPAAGNKGKLNPELILANIFQDLDAAAKRYLDFAKHQVRAFFCYDLFCGMTVICLQDPEDA